MGANTSSQSARAQLRAVIGAGPEHTSAWTALKDLHTAPNSRPAAVLILFGVLDTVTSEHDPDAAVSRDLDVLLLARASTLRSHPGQVAFPGGRIDPEDAGPVDAALREAREETGLDPQGVEVLGTLEPVPLAYSRHVVTPVVGWWQHPTPVHVVDEAESADVFRVPVADLLDPENRGVTVIHRDGREWRGPGFMVQHATGEYLLWGFTALLLDGLFDRLGWTEEWDANRELPLALPDEAR